MLDKNIEMIKTAKDELENAVDNCDSSVPEISSKIAKFLERAFINKEISEREYGLFNLALGMTNARFKRNCRCKI